MFGWLAIIYRQTKICFNSVNAIRAKGELIIKITPSTQNKLTKHAEKRLHIMAQIGVTGEDNKDHLLHK